MTGSLILPANALFAWTPSRSGVLGVLMMITALLLVTFGVFVWAAFFRKPPRRRHHHHHRHHWESADGESEKSNGAFFGFGRRRRRRKRERRQNPTLAETGGLPSSRTDGREPPMTS